MKKNLLFFLCMYLSLQSASMPHTDASGYEPDNESDHKPLLQRRTPGRPAVDPRGYEADDDEANERRNLSDEQLEELACCLRFLAAFFMS